GSNTISDNEISGAGTGIQLDGSADNTIDGNDLHDNGSTAKSSAPNASILVEDVGGAYQPTNNVISNNTIERSANHGISIRTSDNTIEGNTIADSGTGYSAGKESSGIELVANADYANQNLISGNTISGSAFAGIKLGYGADSNTIADNTIEGTLHGGADGSTDAGGGGTAILLTAYGADGTTITGNTLGPNTGYGILQEYADAGGVNSAHQNTIAGNTLGGVRNLDSTDFDATQNWWGDPSGPSGVGPGTGDSVSDGGNGGVVLYDPWLTAAPVAPSLDGAGYVDGGVSLSFTAPSVPAGSTITSYDYEISTDGGTNVSGQFNTGSYVGEFGDTATGSPFTDPNGPGVCGQNTACSYRIRAEIGGDTWQTPWSGWVTVAPSFTAPSLDGAGYVDGGVSLSFTAPSVPAGSTITSYDYEISTDGGTNVSGQFNTG
ncbi:MAG: right-handed parallel beta-helix repeat-containing protein, partial [Mycobacterium sp.]